MIIFAFQVTSRPGILFSRQIPLHSTMDMKEYLKQYTQAEILITEADNYQDGSSAPPQFKTPVDDLEVVEGSFARFECQVTPVMDPYMKVEWTLNGEPIMLGHRFRSVLESGLVQLDILYALPVDAGQYSVTLTNKNGAVRQSATLTVLGKKGVVLGSQMPQGMNVKSMKGQESALFWSNKQEVGEMTRQRRAPQITVPPGNVRVVEGETARFACAISGVPRPKVHWFHNGKMATTGARYKTHFDGMHYLMITYAKPVDAGEIVVVARNASGECQAKANIDVFQSLEFRSVQLRPTGQLDETAIGMREMQWKRETLGQLGEHFKKTRKPDQYALMRVERERKTAHPLESEELLAKFGEKREEEFYEKLLQVRRR